MNLNEEFELFLKEKINVSDHGVGKALFVTGPSGSGKPFVINNLKDGHDLTEFSYDELEKHIGKQFPEDDDSTQKLLDKHAKSHKDTKQLLALWGRNGLIVNGDGSDHTRTRKLKNALEKNGYETSHVNVLVNNKISSDRNVERAQKGGRSKPEKERKLNWEAHQNARQHHAKMFGDSYAEFDNSVDLRTAHPSIIKQKQDELQNLKDSVTKFIKNPPQSKHLQKAIEDELNQTQSHKPFHGGSKLPHPDTEAAKQADELGLQSLGKGLMGKNKIPTHKIVAGSLMELPKKDVVKKPKKTIKEWMEFNKNLLKESIDKGVEPGCPLAGYNKEEPAKNGKPKAIKNTTQSTSQTLTREMIDCDAGSTETLSSINQDNIKKIKGDETIPPKRLTFLDLRTRIKNKRG